MKTDTSEELNRGNTFHSHGGGVTQERASQHGSKTHDLPGHQSQKTLVPTQQMTREVTLGKLALLSGPPFACWQNDSWSLQPAGLYGRKISDSS